MFSFLCFQRCTSQEGGASEKNEPKSNPTFYHALYTSPISNFIVLPHTTHIISTGLIAVARVASVEADYPSIGSVVGMGSRRPVVARDRVIQKSCSVYALEFRYSR